MDHSFRLFPESASTAAPMVDRLYIFLLLVAAFFTFSICAAIIYFVLKYRRGARVDRRRSPHHGTMAIEITWSVLPLLLSMVIFGWGAALYFRAHRPPPDCHEVNVLAKQWMWHIQHSGGQREINTLHVPVGRPVQLRMISEDVIHSFFVPAFRLKQDVLPGRYVTMWFEANKAGRYHLFCAEYCGTSHSKMIGEVVALEPAEFAEWLQGGPVQAPEAAGETLFAKYRCNTCHTTAVHPRCPPLGGLFGSKVTLQGGSTLTADEAYVRESILQPNAKIVAGYQSLMPSFTGQISELELFDLVAYLKSLSKPTAVGTSSETPQLDDPSPPHEEKR
jgi:cytochrome c oxidase subunit II